jgi:ABC-2 type transport system permease protein
MGSFLENTLSLRTELSAVFAFVSRSFRDWASNRTRITLALLWMVSYAAAWGIFAVVALENPTYLEKVNLTAENAVDFILIGQIANIFFWSTQGNLTGVIRGRSFGNLWTAPISFFTIIIGGNGWRLIWLSSEGLVWILMGVLAFGMNFKIDISIIFVLLGGFLVMQSLELIAAGTTIVTKAGQDPVNWFLSITSMLVTGTMFPVQFLPDWLQVISAIHPQRYLLDLSRKSLSLGIPLRELWPDIFRLVITGSVLLVVGIFVFKWGFNKARREGTIGHG